MKISRVFVTHNEFQTTKKALDLFEQTDAGTKIDEVLYADSGSSDGVENYVNDMVRPDVFIKFNENVGIARSHNPLFALATGDLVLLTGCNRVPPKNWAQIFVDHFNAFPHLVAVSFFNENTNAEERTFAPPVHSEGLTVVPGCVMDVIAFKRELFRDLGYYQECFGLWGIEDIEFTSRIQRYCRENGKLAGFIPGYRNKHYGFDPRIPHDPKTSTKAYYEIKKSEVEKFKEKEQLFNQLKEKNFPFFSPY